MEKIGTLKTSAGVGLARRTTPVVILNLDDGITAEDVKKQLTGEL